MGLSREILAGIEERLHEHAGLNLPEWVVETRALGRMSALNLEEAEYLELLGSPRGAVELRALVEAVRVGETSFFRHRPQVDALLDVVVPAWRASEKRGPRVWSAGCATGEEPYTLALVLARAMPRPTFTPTILATDVSVEALAIARHAVYPAAAAEDVPPPWREGLSVEGASVRVRPEVRSLVKFHHQNLADADLPRGFDLVWCRNVLIYFGPQARRRVLEKLVCALEPGGFLFVGYSETLRDIAGLGAVRHGDQVLWQKAVSTPSIPSVSTSSIRAAREAERAAPPAPAPSARAPSASRSGAPERRSGPASRGAAASARGGAGRGPAHAAKRDRGEASKSRAHMRVTAADPATLAAEIREALGAPGLGSLTIDLDGADFIDDAVAPVLRRAGAAAESAGIELLLRATRPGPQRWLRRNGFAGGGE